MTQIIFVAVKQCLVLAIAAILSLLKHKQLAHGYLVHMLVQQRISRHFLYRSAAGELNGAVDKLISVLKLQLLTYLHRNIIILERILMN